MFPASSRKNNADAGRFLDAEAAGAEIINLGARFYFFRRERDGVIAVEIAPCRRKPVEGPAHPRLEHTKLWQRRVRYRHQRGVARRKMRDHRLETVHPERAALAAFAPVGREHEMLD